jgi:hypothetical protein
MLVSVSLRAQGLQLDRLLTATEMFVLSRSFLGALRTAIWNDEADTASPQFAQALTDLVDGYTYQLVKREKGAHVMYSPIPRPAGTPSP